MIREFISYSTGAMYTEWVERTWYGKLFYPLWFFGATLEWLCLFLLVGFAQVVTGMQKLQDTLPKVYRDS